jgi:hypothetical protein
MRQSRIGLLTIITYVVTTALLLAIAGGSMLLAGDADRLDRTRLVSQLSPWIPGFLWLLSAVVAAVLAYRMRAAVLAVAIAGSFLLTAIVLYAWADSVAVVGHGAWDQLRGVTGGGVFPVLAVLMIVAGGALLTLMRVALSWRKGVATPGT